jgi:hypothetical protein
MLEELKKVVDEALKDPTVDISVYRGMKQVGRKGDQEFEPTAAKTIVIEVHGGSNNVRIQRIQTEDDEA